MHGHAYILGVNRKRKGNMMQLTLTFIILALTIILFTTNRLRADLVAIMALLAFVIVGILSPAEALAGFSNSVVIMIAGLFVYYGIWHIC